MKTFKYIFPLLFGLLAFSCGGEQGEALDEPTSGKINITVDETLRPLMETQVATFESIYYRAKIHTKYRPEADAVADLLNDSARLIVVARELTGDEKEVFNKLELTPRSWKIAYDAVALIVNKNNRDSLFDVTKIITLLEGKITTWKQFGSGSSSSAKVKIIFDNKNSGVANYLKNLTSLKSIDNKNAFAVNSSKAVIEYVQKDADALGLISLAWISDREDTTATSFLNSIRVAEVAPADTSEFGGFYYKPYLANIALKKYPLMRSIYIVSREARAGLGLGFSSFVAGDKGQRMVLKAGLLPATMPIRLVEVDNENLQIERENK